MKRKKSWCHLNTSTSCKKLHLTHPPHPLRLPLTPHFNLIPSLNLKSKLQARGAHDRDFWVVLGKLERSGRLFLILVMTGLFLAMIHLWIINSKNVIFFP